MRCVHSNPKSLPPIHNHSQWPGSSSRNPPSRDLNPSCQAQREPSSSRHRQPSSRDPAPGLAAAPAEAPRRARRTPCLRWTQNTERKLAFAEQSVSPAARSAFARSSSPAPLDSHLPQPYSVQSRPPRQRKSGTKSCCPQNFQAQAPCASGPDQSIPVRV